MKNFRKTLYKKRNLSTNNNTTRKRSVKQNYGSLADFQKQVTVRFFEMLLTIKLFHWKTYSYATHKATDELYSKLNEHMDRFMEVLLGKTGIRMDFTKQKTIQLIDMESREKLVEKVGQYKSYLVNLSTNPAMKLMSNMDLLNIRDEILGDMNQFLYLLSLK